MKKLVDAEGDYRIILLKAYRLPRVVIFSHVLTVRAVRQILEVISMKFFKSKAFGQSSSPRNPNTSVIFSIMRLFFTPCNRCARLCSLLVHIKSALAFLRFNF